MTIDRPPCLLLMATPHPPVSEELKANGRHCVNRGNHSDEIEGQWMCFGVQRPEEHW